MTRKKKIYKHNKIEEFLVKTDQKREKGWLYHFDKDSWLCKGRMGWIAGYDENGKTIYVKPIKLFETDIQREKAWLYYVKDGEDGFLEVWRASMED